MNLLVTLFALRHLRRRQSLLNIRAEVAYGSASLRGLFYSKIHSGEQP